MKKIVFICFILSPVLDNAQWVQVNSGIGNISVYSLASIGNNIFAGAGIFSNPHGVYLSTNFGSSWTQTSLNNQSVLSLTTNGNNIFAGTSTIGVYLSTNNGASWTQTSLNNREVWSLAINGNNIYAGTGNQSNGVYLST